MLLANQFRKEHTTDQKSLYPVSHRAALYKETYASGQLRYRDAMGAIGPGGYKGFAPEFGGDLLEVNHGPYLPQGAPHGPILMTPPAVGARVYVQVLADPGDAVLFHHLMGHSGSHNVASPHTRHALLNRYHPSTRLVPPPDRTPEQMSTMVRGILGCVLPHSWLLSEVRNLS